MEFWALFGECGGKIRSLDMEVGKDIPDDFFTRKESYTFISEGVEEVFTQDDVSKPYILYFSDVENFIEYMEGLNEEPSV